MDHSSGSLTHTLYHLGVKVLLVALAYVVIILVLKSATRTDKTGSRKSKRVEGQNRRQRRMESAMNRHKRRW